ncbi:dUTP diphosphatase [Crocosphaera chwakensis]|uniref:Deoxyuridine 5'-triphosphate nucleotidohydrolase n=1 Tax=Crocosphaera chwakensis CCY0110 TaxID=391612 RepID=A3ILK0_9CHRO|nr:dUTP diphosphatase [Crocosphaera chwakensis]EAZ92651.1 deoxyuridine 5-triphosphate nucleotidohydrolase [Crocosphaera chwakensis CCY0110]
MKLKIKRLNEKAILPNYAHFDDSGMDLFSIEKKELKPNTQALIKTGLAIELPENTEAQIRPRSGLALKHGITVLNTPGTIDQGYRGEIGVILINHSQTTFLIEYGMKIAQMIIMPIIRCEIEEVIELSITKRNERGFGSTGV